ncbi:MAG: o-succinylbenzoate--CoA ligase, partial [Deltaproteobacteria bacterium]
MLFGDILRQNASKLPNKTAVIYRDLRLSYSELNNRTNQLANALLGMGLNKGDRVAVLADNCSQYVEVYFATAKDGLSIVPLNTNLDINGLTYIINDSGANTLIFGEKYSETINSLRPEAKMLKNFIVLGQAREGLESYEGLLSQSRAEEPGVVVDEEDIAWILYTSGTTGPPKGVMQSHKNLISDTVSTLLTCFPINRNDVHINLLPMFHVGGLWHMRCCFYIGGTNVLLDRPAPETVLETIQKERVTTTCFVPPMIVPIIDYPGIDQYDVSSMRIMIYSGAPLPEGLYQRMKRIFGDIIIQVYALTEATGGVIMPPLMEGPWEEVKRPGSCGKEVLGVEVRLIDEEGQDCAPGQVGEILVRGDNVMKGYWGMSEATAKALEEGYLHTGDLAFKDEEGYYYITGRKKDVISSGGQAIYSPEVEDVISLHPAVAEVAVVGVPDEQLGEVVKAVVVLKADEKATEEELIEWCKGRLED